MPRRRSAPTTWQWGATAVELAVALPVLLLTGLVMLQLALTYRARLAIEQAATEAARSGSTGHAQDESLLQGLARGMAPLLFGADGAVDLQQSEAKALATLSASIADGSLALRRIAPDRRAFDDWAEPALDDRGEPIAGMVEIPNDNLAVRRLRSQPRSGTAGYRGEEPIGSVSGLTLVDANILKVELEYGLRLTVPLAGRIVAATIRALRGCAAAATPGAGGRADGPAGDAGASAALCRHLTAEPPRLPLHATAAVRMMSAARQPDAASAVPIDLDSGLLSVADGGAVPDASAAGEAGRAGSGAGGRRPGSGPDSGAGSGEGVGSGSGSERLGNGFLGVGSDRPYPSPSLGHPALCGD